MKNKILSIAALCAASLIYSCKGPEVSAVPVSNARLSGTNNVYSESKSLLIDKVLSGNIKGRVMPLDCPFVNSMK